MTLAAKNPTILDRELSLESLIDEVQTVKTQASAEHLRGLILRLRQMMFPVGYKVKVQLEEDGRKKRSTADASYWSFHSGDLVLYFEPNPDPVDEGQPLGPLPVPSKPNSTAGSAPPELPAQAQSAVPAASLSTAEELEIQQCVQALVDAEKLGKQFIAYKWFRDLVLAGLAHNWARDAERRQQVLTAAIESGRISIQKIPNPRQPMFPTTTLSINRTGSVAGIKSRFRPVEVTGEPVSTTLLRDRG